jgi:hypothetical protein
VLRKSTRRKHGVFQRRAIGQVIEGAYSEGRLRKRHARKASLHLLDAWFPEVDAGVGRKQELPLPMIVAKKLVLAG